MDEGRRPQPMLALAALGSGGALVLSLLTGAPLWLGLLGAVGAAAFLGAFRWSHASDRERAELAARLRAGAIAGVLATVAYDIVRWALVVVGRMELSPFGAFPLFGELLVGSAPAGVHLLLGGLYHLVNGLAFAVSYCLLVGGRGWQAGVLWGLGLEAAMLAVYPGWLDLDAVLGEFVSMSFLGHVAYGAVLGRVSARLLAGPPSRRAVSA